MRCWVHGAYATKNSFNYLKTQMDLDNDVFIEYKSDSDLIDVLNEIRKKLQAYIDAGEEIDLIGHSLGGVLCLILVQTGLKVRSITTLSAPFGGITNHFLLRFWFPKSIYTEFHKLEEKYMHLIEMPVKIPYRFFVSTKGKNPLFLGKENDGVVTVEAQTFLDEVEYFEVDLNHYEILMDQETAFRIRNFHRSLSNNHSNHIKQKKKNM